MKTHEVRLSGFGGQGIVLAGYILGKAASIYDRLNTTLTQSYGPESRGGACAAELIISDAPIDFPKITRPDILVAMSQEAYDKYIPSLREGGLLIVEEDLVDPGVPRGDVTLLSVPMTRCAIDLGRRIVANIVMLGFLTATSDVVTAEAMRAAIASTVPKGTEKLNLDAFERGYQLGAEISSQRSVVSGQLTSDE